MSKQTPYIHIARSIALSSLMASTVFMNELSSSIAQEVKGPQVIYGNCASIQRYLNSTNKASQQYRGFEKSKLNQVYYNNEEYMIFCNGGTVIDGEENLICRGYIGYSWSGYTHTARYYGHWGWTNGFRNDGSIKKNCRQM
jgi:hypothetical protein